VKDNFISRVPLLSQNYELSMLQATSRLSEPGKAVNGRQTRLWTAEGIGGASRINAMITTRGVPGGYNEWSSAFGLADWSWDKVEPFFRMNENAESHPGAIHRGHNGPVVNRQIPLPLACYPFIESALQAVGLPFGKDVNDPAAHAQGYFNLDLAITSNGERVSSYKAWLDARTANERKSHLTICTGVVASKLEVDMKQKQITGVHYRKAKSQGDSNRSYFVKARREVILCTGAICTPQLLMLRYYYPRSICAHCALETNL
jgi:choline dehydrogenase-like flavoprotein